MCLWLFTCCVEQVVKRLELFALKHRDAHHPENHRYALDDVPGDGPPSLVVPYHPAVVQGRRKLGATHTHVGINGGKL